MILSDSIFHHIQGQGIGSIKAQIFDETQLTGHTYRILFDDTTFNHTVYNIFDKNIDSIIIRNAGQLDGVTEGPPFDGMRLLIYNYPQAEIDNDSSGWINSQTNLTHKISLANVIIGPEQIKGFLYAADYKITLFDHVVDTSSTFLGAPAVPIKFKVINETASRPTEIILTLDMAYSSLSSAIK